MKKKVGSVKGVSLESFHRRPLKAATKVLKHKHPEIAHSASKPFKSFKYPKITTLVLFIILAYYIFTSPFFDNMINTLTGHGYFSVVLAGLLFSYGFTTPFAIAMLVFMNPENILMASLVAGFGAFVSDFIIFKAIKTSFLDEFEELKKTKLLAHFKGFIDKSLHAKLRIYLLYFVAGFVIASPIPDEFGVTMLAGLSNINPKIFGLLSFILNSFGIFLIFTLF